MPKQKILYYDLETTGTDLKRNSVHQIAAIMEVDGVEVDRFNLPFAPHPKCECTAQALAVCGFTEEALRGRRHSYEDAYKGFERFLSQHIDRYNKADKAHLCGYNNRGFDDQFLRRFFEHNGNPYFGSWFYSDSFDAMVFASYHLRSVRHRMPNFKQGTVAAQLGIEVDDNRLHDADYDLELLRQIWGRVTSEVVVLPMGSYTYPSTGNDLLS